MGTWGIFSYYGGNERITLVRDTGVGINIKHKLFYIVLLNIACKSTTRARNTTTTRKFEVLQHSVVSGF
jgi:hypothetical protein